MNEQQLKKQFTAPILAWFDQYGRKDLPWQNPRTPYRVWISEIMLQQTQVQTVIPYFNRFMQKVPNLEALAKASEDQILALWSGLGYYSRARNLHKAAQEIQKEYKGVSPKDLHSLQALPGIGQSTAGAILSQAFNQPAAVLDANVKRVLARFFLIAGSPEQAATKKRLWQLAHSVLAQKRCADYTQALMDLGALCCLNKNPRCSDCPVQTHCLAFKQQKQSLYPTKKIKKPIPQKQEQMLVLYNAEGFIYLEKNPAHGIWANLWCLPTLAFKRCPLAFIEAHYSLQGELPQALLAFKHRLTHLHLDIQALSIQIKNLKTKLPGKWYHKAELGSLGLAKPTSLILESFFDTKIS